MTKAEDVVRFWSEAGEERWFARDDDFDRRFRERFLPAHEQAAAGRLSDWERSAEGALALVLLLDQFPRNCFRDTPRAFATDAQAISVADRAIGNSFDRQIEERLRVFLYLPYEHSERLLDQERALALFADVGGETGRFAVLHHELIVRFGRFPHRNRTLGRTTTAEEQAYLDAGGFSG